MTQAEIRKLIIETLSGFRPVGEGAFPIFGDGVMDSMGLVVFLAELEARIAERTGRDLVLASERAMSRSESPYRDVDALTVFVIELLGDSGR